jgi:predicted nucleotide-binding protein (sugar kinase/HSP70/actin superfamily)
MVIPRYYAIYELLGRASRAFAAIGAQPQPPRPRITVFLSGDIYCRLDSFANDALIARLNQQGIQVIIEPPSTLVAYCAENRVSDILGLPTARGPNFLIKKALGRLRQGLYRRVQRHHPWLPLTPISAILRRCDPLLQRYPLGEAPLAVGSVLEHWRQGLCDGIVLANPWGCGPALISESLLRHQSQIPLFFLYCDGTPLDQGKLDSFIFSLRRRRRMRDAPRL